MRPQPTLIVKCVNCKAEREYLLPKKAYFEYDQRLREYVDKLEAELTALKTPPRCPKCWNPEVEVMLDSNLKYYMSCCPSGCCWEESGFNTLDSALNAWRKG